MTERDDLIARFLEQNGWADADCGLLAGDASFRKYFRLIDGDRRAVLMDAPPPKEDVRPFVAVARHLNKMGLSAPEVYAEDAAAGLLLLEDLGDATYTRMLADGADAEELYAAAIDVLIHIHDRAPEAAIPRALPPYDAVILLSAEAAQKPAVGRALAPLIGAIDADLMREANAVVEVERRSVSEAAQLILDAVEP